MHKVSIVIPVYNIPSNVLKCCVKSVSNQDYRNIEIFLVDDGSPGNCGAICDDLAKEDTRITVIHKENGGVSSARNEGIRHATGEYVVFVDADDGIHHQMISILLEDALKYRADIVVCNYQRFFSDELPESVEYDKGHSCLYFAEEKELISLQKKCIIEDGTMGARFNGAPWAKLYSLHLLKENNLLLDTDLVRSQDNYFNFLVFGCAKRVCYTAASLYFYRYLPSSSVNKYRSNLYDISNKYLTKIKDAIRLSNNYEEYKITYDYLLFEKTNELCVTCVAHPDNTNGTKDKCMLIKKVRETWLKGIDMETFKNLDFSLRSKFLYYTIIHEDYKLAYYISRFLYDAKMLYNKYRIVFNR